MKKVAHYKARFIIGGIETHIENLVNNMTNFDSTVIVDGKPDVNLKDKLHRSNVIGIGPDDIDTSLILRKTPPRFADSINAPVVLFRNINLYNHIIDNNYDLIHIHALGINRFLWALGEGYRNYFIKKMKRIFSNLDRKRSVIFTDHSIFSWLKKDSIPDNIFNPLAEFYLDVFNNLICVEKEGYTIVNRIIKEKGIEKRLWYIPNSIDTELFSYSKHHTKEHLIIGYVARLGRQGESFLMDFIKKLPEYIELHIAGGSISETKSIQYKEIFKHPRIKFYFNIPYHKMPDFYHGIDILLNSSPSPGIGRNSLEALSCGKPVIMIGNSDRYPIIDGQTGFLINDNESLINLIDKICLKPENIMECGKNARAIIKNEFSNETVFPKIEQVYNIVHQSYKK